MDRAALSAKEVPRGERWTARYPTRAMSRTNVSSRCRSSPPVDRPGAPAATEPLVTRRNVRGGSLRRWRDHAMFTPSVVATPGCHHGRSPSNATVTRCDRRQHLGRQPAQWTGQRLVVTDQAHRTVQRSTTWVFAANRLRDVCCPNSGRRVRLPTASDIHCTGVPGRRCDAPPVMRSMTGCSPSCTRRGKPGARRHLRGPLTRAPGDRGDAPTRRPTRWCPDRPPVQPVPRSTPPYLTQTSTRRFRR